MDLQRRRRVQAVLMRYEYYQRQVANYDLERRSIEASYPKNTWQPKVTGNKGMADPTAQAAAKLERLDAETEKARFYVEAIDDVMDFLPDLQQDLVRQRYFESKSPEVVADKLHIGRSTLFQYDREVLIIFAFRLGL